MGKKTDYFCDYCGVSVKEHDDLHWTVVEYKSEFDQHGGRHSRNPGDEYSFEACEPCARNIVKPAMDVLLAALRAGAKMGVKSQTKQLGEGVPNEVPVVSGPVAHLLAGKGYVNGDDR